MTQLMPGSYKTPFSPAYWRQAAQDMKNVRILAFSALMTAACVALSYVPSIPINDGVKVTWGFLARALCSMVGGPLNALVFGFVEDNLSFFLHPTGAYFPGYTLTTMLGNLIYALLLYRTRVSAVRIVAAKGLTNVLNVFLSSVWSAMLYSKGYLYYMTTKAVKNAVMLPVQAAMLIALFGALLPVLKRMGFLPRDSKGRIVPW